MVPWRLLINRQWQVESSPSSRGLSLSERNELPARETCGGDCSSTLAQPLEITTRPQPYRNKLHGGGRCQNTNGRGERDPLSARGLKGDSSPRAPVMLIGTGRRVLEPGGPAAAGVEAIRVGASSGDVCAARRRTPGAHVADGSHVPVARWGDPTPYVRTALPDSVDSAPSSRSECRPLPP